MLFAGRITLLSISFNVILVGDGALDVPYKIELNAFSLDGVPD